MIITVKKMAEVVGLSRSRFFDLTGTVFPKPKYHPVTNKPYYDEAQQEQCLETRRSGIGFDGHPALFNEFKKVTVLPLPMAVSVTKELSSTVEKVQRRDDLRRHREYGLSPGDYEAMLVEQKGCCRICGNKPNKPLHVDHCHQTGAVRGLLCADCNTGLGMFHENVEMMRKAIRYLEDTASWKQNPLIFSR